MNIGDWTQLMVHKHVKNLTDDCELKPRETWKTNRRELNNIYYQAIYINII